MAYLVYTVGTLITALILWYLRRARKRGETCIGCPHAKACRSRGSCQCGNDSLHTDKF
ncbi:MAG: hypothetical protein IKC69_05630 [Clostridia bacterium]|nr:hypothetical protein [Clostridia bacterium]